MTFYYHQALKGTISYAGLLINNSTQNRVVIFQIITKLPMVILLLVLLENDLEAVS